VPAENARDRIGSGPWYNAKSTLIARDLDELHGTNMLTKQTALTEKGVLVNGRGDTPNMHDMLTESQPDGKAFPPVNDMTCKNWTSSTVGNAMLGHSDRTGTFLELVTRATKCAVNTSIGQRRQRSGQLISAAP
jgi:hypothetical protein